MMSVRTRFAPSPTGFLHAGGVRTALFAWLYARQNQGQFILRIEDTDKQRETAGSIQHIKDSLEWLGLTWDEDYLQSARLDIYRQHAQNLVDKGLAYVDPFSAGDVEAFRQAAKDAKRAFLFRDHRPNDLAVPADWYGQLPLRFKTEQLKRYEWRDAVRGDLSAGEEALDDFVLIKADGYPTYNFAHVVDDHLMDISHVMRGEEFIASLPKFLSLLDAFGWDWPTFATLPPVLAKSGGQKLSKRDGAKDVLEYRDDGYLPEAVVNFLASLGWNDGTDQEIFSIQELIDKFSLDRIQKSGAKFDDTKLDWMNWQHLKRLITNDIQQALRLAGLDGADGDQDYLSQAAQLAAGKSSGLADFKRQMAIFTREPDFKLSPATLTAIDANLTIESAKGYLAQAAERLGNLDPFTAGDIEAVLRQAASQLKVEPRIFLNLVRWAASGHKVSPSLFDLLAVLGRDRTVDRLKSASAQSPA